MRRPHRVLVIEGHRHRQEFLAKGLADAGYVVEVATDGQEGLPLVVEKPYDIIILDIIESDNEGWSVLEGIRCVNTSVPVLFLTASIHISDRVKGLDLGADDFLVKPFAWQEFIARIKALLRRGRHDQFKQMLVGDLHLDLAKMRARRGETVIALTAGEFQILCFLALHAGTVISRETLAARVWGIEFGPGSNTIDVAVSRLRKKVDGPFTVKLIHTIRGFGFVMSRPVSALEDSESRPLSSGGMRESRLPATRTAG